MTRRFKLRDRVELTPGARKGFPHSSPTGLVIGVGGMVMLVQHDDGTKQTWNTRHWQLEVAERKPA